MGESGSWSPPVRKLVVAKKIEVHDRETARHVHLSADRHNFAKRNADAHARQHHAQLLRKPLTPKNAAGGFRQSNYQLEQDERGDANHRGQLKQNEEEDVKDSPGAPHITKPRVCDAEIAFRRRRPAREDVRPRTSSLEQSFALTGKLLLEPAGQFGIKEHPHLAAFTIQKAKGRHAGFDSIVELALNRRRGAWQARVKGMKRIASVLAQSAKERHAPRRHRRLQLTPGQAVDLNQEQARFFAGALAGGQAKMTNSPFITTEAPTKAMPE